MRALVGLTSFLSSLVAADRLFHFYLALYWHLSRRKPEAAFKCSPLPDPARSGVNHPMVVVQIPMFNEKEVCEQVIDAACELHWQRECLMVQVLDDSTCPVTRSRIVSRVLKWQAQGVNIVNKWRPNRQGFKAGAMLEAAPLITKYEFTAIFDADFKPERDFLHKTVPYLKDNPRVAFVQTRWTFANANESMLTRVQEISLNYHLKCEQYSRSASGNFFNFNGTAGVWRRSAIEDAGGWNNRTTVEDMDLSLRAFLKGWKFIFLNDVEVAASETGHLIERLIAPNRTVPLIFYRACVPLDLRTNAVVEKSNVTRVGVEDIVAAEDIFESVLFGTRLFATHIVSFVFYCTLVPICVLAPEVSIPYWALIYVPLLVTISTIAFTPRSWYYAVPFVLFENAMSIIKMSAMFAGFLELADSHSWVVTKKLGHWHTDAAPVLPAFTTKGESKLKRKSGKPWRRRQVAYLNCTAATVHDYRLYGRELCMATFIFAAALYGIVIHSRWQYCVFLLLQSLAFAAFGLDLTMFGGWCAWNELEAKPRQYTIM
eukprot:SM000317S12250  [mRNA]  locus=s317:110226:113283:- [translate_table: standard]